MSHSNVQTARMPVVLTRAVSALALGSTLALAPALPGFAQDGAVSLTEQVGVRPQSFAELAEQVSPAVVNITTTTVISGRAGPQDLLPKDGPFEDFFRDFEDRDSAPPQRSSALGSGFVISADGFIVTNNHVIEGADEIEIEFFPVDGSPRQTLPAVVVGTDPKTDIALLKVESETPLPHVSFGDSDGDAAEVGDWVMAMGNPLGQGFSVSAGIISARGRSLSGTYDDYIQTDAAINQGNSGGPLFNMDGEVIGVNTAILSPNGGSIGIGFAMSSSVVSKVVDQLKEFGETRRGWLGVSIQNVTPEMVEAIEGLDMAQGALVSDVPPGPARDAGMLAGDVILSFNGRDVADTVELVNMVGDAEVGATVPVEVLRQGEMTALEVTLGRRETAEGTAQPGNEQPMEPAAAQIEGLTVEPLTNDLIDRFELAGAQFGVVIMSVDPDSAAAKIGLAAGDLITEAGQSKVETVSDLEEQIDEARAAGRRSILLLLRRGGDPRFVGLPLDE